MCVFVLLVGFGHRHCQHSQQTWTTNAIECMCVSMCVGVCVFRLFEPMFFVWNYYSVMLMGFHCNGNQTRVVMAFFPACVWFFFVVCFFGGTQKIIQNRTERCFFLGVGDGGLRGGGGGVVWVWWKLELGCRPCLTIPKKFLCVYHWVTVQLVVRWHVHVALCLCVSVCVCLCPWMVDSVVCCWRCDPYLTVVFLFSLITPPASFI